MGEAKRRKDLGIQPRLKKNQKDQSERLISWLPITKKQLSRYPYAAPVTMAIGLILLLIDWTNLNVGAGWLILLFICVCLSLRLLIKMTLVRNVNNQ